MSQSSPSVIGNKSIKTLLDVSTGPINEVNRQYLARSIQHPRACKRLPVHVLVLKTCAVNSGTNVRKCGR